MLGEGGEADDVDTRGAVGCPFHDHRGTRVPQRERGELLAEQGADLPRRVPAQVRDVLAGNDHAAADLAAADEIGEDEHPGQHAGTRVGQVEVHGLRGADRLFDVQAERRLEGLPGPTPGPGDAGADQHLEVRRPALRMSQAIAGRPGGQGEGILAGPDHVAFVDTGQPLQLDVGAVPGLAHQVSGRQPPGGQLHPHALDPAPPGAAGSGRFEGQPLLRLLAALVVGHESSTQRRNANDQGIFVRMPGGRGKRHWRDRQAPMSGTRSKTAAFPGPAASRLTSGVTGPQPVKGGR